DVSVQGSDTALAAGDRPAFWRPRSHHGPARCPQDRPARRQRQRAGRGRRSAETHAVGITPASAHLRNGRGGVNLPGPARGRCGRRGFPARRRSIFGTEFSAMKVTLERAALLKSLGHVHRVVERRTTIPILSNVLVRAEKDGLRLQATDLDLEVVETTPADIATAGTTTVPAHTFYDIVRKLPEGAQVALEQSGESGTLTIRSGRSRFALQTLAESDFPDLAAGEMP